MQNPHKGLAREISHKIGIGQGKEGSRVKRRRQNREVKRRKQDRTGQSAGESRRVLGCVDSEAKLANVRGWVSIPGSFEGISLEYMLTLALRCTESYAKVSQTSPFLRLELTQVRVCSLFFNPLGCIYCVLCVRKEMWNTPGQSWEKQLDDLMAMSGLRSWNSGVGQRWITFMCTLGMNFFSPWYHANTFLHLGCFSKKKVLSYYSYGKGDKSNDVL